jgi:CheY-specific phosphatase CheX
MSTTTIELQEWLDSLAQVARDYAAKHLRFDRGVDGSGSESKGDGATGVRPAVYVSILGAKSSMHLGLATTTDGAQALARAFLGLRSRDALADRDVVDSLSEILNIVAGKVKSRMSARDGSLKLGLPMFVSGAVGHGDGVERASIDVMMGRVSCQLQVFRQSRQS